MRYSFLLLLIICFSLTAAENESAKRVLSDDTAFQQGYVERQILRYQKLIKDYQVEIQSLLKRNVEEKKRLVSLKYASPIKSELLKESTSRTNAIVLFENFIKKYPKRQDLTPRAMYRLAELYYEKSVLAQEKKLDEYDKLMTTFESGELKKEPTLPVVDFTHSIDIYSNLITNFPNFKYLGGAYYMLGFCLDASNRPDEAVKVWHTILDKKIKTNYAAEIYLRLGDYYFSTNDLPTSLMFFRKGIEDKESPFYDKILYKLAWTNYRANKFDDAVVDFTKLVYFADDMKSKGEDRGQDLRKEAVQYIAISFADEEWGSIDKAIAYFSKIDGEKFEIDVFERLGKYYSENSNFSEAIKAYKYVLKKHPNYEKAPKIHHSLIKTYEKAREFEKAFVETDLFAKKYDRDSEWAIKNRANVTAIRFAADLAKQALYSSAFFHHAQAQSYKDKGEMDKAKEEYFIASISYREYLKKFPYTSESYEITYQLADALYYSGDLNRAVVFYERVRDDKNQDKHKEVSAENAFICYNDIYQNSEEVKITSDQKRDKPFTVLEKKLIESTDIYLTVNKGAPNAAAASYMTSRIFFDHGNFAEAEKRYLSIINEHPDSDAAFMAARDIVGAYQEKKDWVNVAKWSKILSDRLAKKSGDKVAKAKEEFRAYRLGAMFLNASNLQKEGKHREAANEYLSVVEENPYHENAVKALFNAAFSFEKALMFDSAMKLHERIYKDYPYSEFAADSLWLVAYNAERSYNFKKAVFAYEQLYKNYKNHKNRNNAIYNAGIIRENLKEYKKAAKNYYLYFKAEDKKVDGKEAAYRVGLMYEKAKDWKGMIKKYKQFIKTYKTDSTVAHLVMRSYYRIAIVYDDEFNNQRSADQYYKNIVDYYSSQKDMKDEAIAYAAEASFKLLEKDFDKYLKMKIGGRNQKKLMDSFKNKTEVKNDLEKRYMEILKFGVYDWVLASLYKIGYLYQAFADAMYTAEAPSGLSEEEQDIYTEMLEERSEPIEQAAIDKYTAAVNKANELKVYNKWTQLMIEKLSVLRPEDYKVGKKPVFGIDSSLDIGYPVLLLLDKQESKKYKKSGMKKENVTKKEDKSSGEKTIDEVAKESVSKKIENSNPVEKDLSTVPENNKNVPENKE